VETAEVKQNEECSCLLSHGYKKETVLAAGFEITNFMPSGVKALFLSDNQTLKEKLSRFYKLHIPDEFDTAGVFFRILKKFLKKSDIPEDIRLVISEGGYNTLGKYAAAEIAKRGAGTKHLMCGGGNLSRFDFVQSANGFDLKKFPKCTVLEDFEGIDPPSGFAFVINMYLALFDWDIAALLFGGGGGNVRRSGGSPVCGYVFSEAQKTVHNLLEAVRIHPKRSARLKKEIFSACLSVAALIETAGASLLQSGAIQAAAAFSMLLTHERRKNIDLFDAAFLLSPVVARAYAAFLESPPFSFPPDNSLHAARLTEYLGVNEFESAGMPPPYLKIREIELADYRLQVYQDEFLRHIYDVIRVINEAYPVYFKLFDDDGFWLKDFLSLPDVSLSLALGADVLHGDTLLHYIRGRGLLDRYLHYS